MIAFAPDSDFWLALRQADRVRRRLDDACQARGLVLVGVYRQEPYRLDVIVRDRQANYRSIRGDRADHTVAWTQETLDEQLVENIVGKL